MRSCASREGQRRLDGLYDRIGFKRFDQAVLDVQLAHDALKFFTFQGGIVERRRDDHPSGRKGLSKVHQILRSLIVVRHETGNDQVERRRQGFDAGRLQSGTVSYEVFHSRQCQFDEPFQIEVRVDDEYVGHIPPDPDSLTLIMLMVNNGRTTERTGADQCHTNR